MTRKEALTRARECLDLHQIPDAPLEAELLLRYALGTGRAQLYTGLDDALTPEQEEKYRRLLERRQQGEPAAYITGQREFYGLDFYVNRHVLIPRPETELLVEQAIALVRQYGFRSIADIGTGAGVIAVSLARNLPEVRICATDISAEALAVARLNCRRHGVSDRITLRQGDLLEPLPAAVDVIIANLPYVPEAELDATPSLRSEPKQALNGGADGLETIKRLCPQLPGRIQPGGYLLLEIGRGQAEAVTGLLSSLFPTAGIVVEPDLAGIPRVIRTLIDGR